MFCPNCGGDNRSEQNYCRTCGLKLDAISQAVAEQRPSAEYAELRRRKERFEKLGLLTISVTAVIAVSLIFGKALYWKLGLFGPEVLFWSAFVAMMVFGLLSVFLFNYTKLTGLDKVNHRLGTEADQLPAPSTRPLIEDRPFDPAASVVENTTELLKHPAK